jgi:hypothetical protein
VFVGWSTIKLHGAEFSVIAIPPIPFRQAGSVKSDANFPEIRAILALGFGNDPLYINGEVTVPLPFNGNVINPSRGHDESQAHTIDLYCRQAVRFHSFQSALLAVR